jgi:hypothetical protein
MINITFDKLKLVRTYKGGNKKEEIKIFNEIQLDYENNTNLIFQYKSMLLDYINDILHVMFSWKIITEIISYFLLALSIITLEYFTPSIILCFLSIIFFGTSKILNEMLKTKLKVYDTAINILKQEIYNKTGVALE